jgi:hypothetical protein
LREVAVPIAAAVAAVAHDQKLASRPRPTDLVAEVVRAMYVPQYA